MSHISVRWLGSIILVLASQLSIGCPQPQAVTKPTGLLTLPPGSTTSKILKAKNISTELLPFDGNYPGSWPKEFQLPADFHTTNGEIRKSTVPKSSRHAFTFSGIGHQDPFELVTFFREELRETGYRLVNDTGVERSSSVPVYAAIHSFLAIKNGDDGPQIMITIFKDDDLNGWTYFSGGFME